MARVVSVRSEDSTGLSAAYDTSHVEIRVASQPINLAVAERLVGIAWAILLGSRGREEFPSATIRSQVDLSAL